MRPSFLVLALTGSAILAPMSAQAHGGLPISMGIVWREKTIYLPTQYWGVFVGTDGGPWQWICDEAINEFKLRDVVKGRDGTLYATDLVGLTISRDGGCSWSAVTGEMAFRDVNSVVPDPAMPARVWAAAIENGRGALFRSDDSGQSWSPIFTTPSAGQRGVALSPDGRRVYMTGLDEGADMAPTLFVSTDGGQRFDPRPILPRPSLVRARPLFVDPRDPQVIYLVQQGDPTHALLRADLGDGSFTEVLRLELPIYGITVDVARDRLLVASGSGIYYADGKAALRRSDGLSRAQCATMQDGTLYACSWNYPPDLAAVARSMDGGLSFTPVFQFDKTQVLAPVRIRDYSPESATDRR